MIDRSCRGIPAGLAAGLVTIFATTLALCPRVAAGAATPHASSQHYPLSNGFGAVVFNASAGKLDTFLDHAYARWDEDTPSIDVLFDAYFGVAFDGEAGVWLNALPVDEVGYEDGRGILVVQQSRGGARLTTRVTMPMDLPAPGFVMELTVQLVDGSPRELTLFSLHNAHVGPGAPEAGSSDESVTWDAERGRFLERGTTTDHAVLWAPLDPPDHHAAAPADSLSNPWRQVTEAGALEDSDGLPSADDQVSAFSWTRAVATDQPAVARLVVLYGSAADGPEALHEGMDSWLRGRDDGIADARREWDAWSEVTPAAPLADPTAARLYRQSLALLRMGQVREPNGPAGSPHGQLLASLPPGMWNISWPRDAAYAIRALALAGHHDEARDALAFLLRGHGQAFTAEAQGPYRISVCRYFGNGAEESDRNEFGPNIEFDGFGLSLWALATYVDATEDEDFVHEHWATVRDEIAGALVRLVDPETGLVRADSSIWEVHWNGQEKRFAYTSVLAVRGLCDAARLADRVGDEDSAATWRTTARSLHDAIRRHLVTPRGLLAANLEELRAGGGYLDAAVVEAFNLGVIPMDDPIATTTLDLLLAGLAVPSGHGYARNDDGGWYDRQEWVVVDLRIARALRALGRVDEADALVDWVVAQSAANGYLVAELYERDRADYEGAIPMMGFGAGAYVLDAWERDVPDALAGSCWTDPSPEPVAEPVAEPAADTAGGDVGPRDASDTGSDGRPDATGSRDGSTGDTGGADSIQTDRGATDRGAPPPDLALDLSPRGDVAAPRASGGCATAPAPGPSGALALLLLLGTLLAFRAGTSSHGTRGGRRLSRRTGS